MRFHLSDESADAEGAIGDEETHEMSRKEPEDGELRVLVQVLRSNLVDWISNRLSPKGGDGLLFFGQQPPTPCNSRG